jgi:(S)-ureidoglycine aminohydrolase
MNQFGATLSASRRDHLLQTPDTFVRALREGVTSIVHISPATGARFMQYTAEFEAGGSLGPAGSSERFVYVLEGELPEIGGVRILSARRHAGAHRRAGHTCRRNREAL